MRPGLGLVAALLGSTALAQELPTGGSVVAGGAVIGAPSGGQMAIGQTTGAAVIDWQSFSIGQGGRVDITQPGVQSALLNRVTGATTSQIHGQLTANGQIFVVNPNGIFIGPTGRIGTGGFVASTLGIGTDDFMAGRYRFEGDGSSATVENAGRIDVVPGGYAALIGGRAKNSGVIRVPLGRVGLAAGERVTLDVSGDGFLQVAVPSQGDETMEALVENSGRIEAEGGQVHMMAASARDAARQVVNMSGVIEARSVGGRSGAVVLGGGGGAVRVTGRIDTSARAQVATSPRPVARPETQPGGDITITGAAIELAGATLVASGAGAGQGGLIRVGGDFKGSGDLARALTAHVDAATRLIADGGESGDGGRIVVWSDVFTDFSGQISARGGDAGGDGGFAEVSGLADLRYRGLADTRAPAGQVGMLLLDPSNITVPGTIDAATIESNLSTTSFTLDTSGPGPDAGDITINEAISWSSGFSLGLDADNDIAINAPIIGSALTVLAGGTITTGPAGAIGVGLFEIFAGDWIQLGPVLPAFDADDFRLDPDYTGTFLRALGGTGGAGDPYRLTDIYGVQGIRTGALPSASFVLANDIDAEVTGTWREFDGPFGFDTIPVFSGTLDGARYVISDLFVNDFVDGGLFGTISAGATVTDLGLVDADVSNDEGGLLADTNLGTIANSSVEGVLQMVAGVVGGMVGTNAGIIRDSFADIEIDAFSFAATPASVGGLAGQNFGTILRSHSSGTVDVSESGGAFVSAGGLVGFEQGTITDSYSLADVTLTQSASNGGAVGGLVGINEAPIPPGSLTITNSFSAGTPSATGAAAVGGLVGLNTGTVINSFWDTDASGVGTSAAGTGLTTAQFQDTAGFLALTQPLGWDFAGAWAPGAPGAYPTNYSTSPVVFVQPGDFTVQYGQTPTATAPGTIGGGAGSFVFGPLGDTLDTSGLLSNLSYGSQTVGTTPFTIPVTGLTSAQGVGYAVRSLGATATITPAPLTVTALNQSRVENDEFVLDQSAFAVTGLVFSDSVGSVALSSAGAASDATAAGSPYAINLGTPAGSGLSNYSIALVPGQLAVLPEATPPVPPVPVIPPPPTVDTTITGGTGGTGGGTTGGTAVTPTDRAALALGTVESFSEDFEARAAACAGQDDDVGAYLACLADAMDSYSDDLERLVSELPPELSGIADIIRDASAGIRAAGAEAQARLAVATSAAERAAIRREAVGKARAALQTAETEIRKAISLIRATDPELAGLHRQQAETVIAAVGRAEIGMSRVLEL
ncbi:filamentous hemagglutinin N-terminal domain-containing protein [Cribrihabitans marinus]|uniref:two-partner secretion domain-containing protein n=1 Tax=Cribrihabitans marinus TaxID=1227549 RepID=UPI000A662335|nr:filamentous hemagglutinin N-terminal domain-containing protein [Cribrihabitans marinus]